MFYQLMFIKQFRKKSKNCRIREKQFLRSLTTQVRNWAKMHLIFLFIGGGQNKINKSLLFIGQKIFK
jgi:hypothetical protein